MAGALVNKSHFSVDIVYTIGYGGSVPHAGCDKSAYVGLRRDKTGTDSGFRSLGCSLT
jgi:hypothetical protein